MRAAGRGPEGVQVAGWAAGARGLVPTCAAALAAAQGPARTHPWRCCARTRPPHPLVSLSYRPPLARLVYGLAITDYFIAVPNGVGALLGLVYCALICAFPRRSSK